MYVSCVMHYTLPTCLCCDGLPQRINCVKFNEEATLIVSGTKLIYMYNQLALLMLVHATVTVK